MTLLHLAAKSNFPFIIEELLANGLRDFLEARDRHGQTPFFIAFCHNSIAAMKVLLSAGANPMTTNNVIFFSACNAAPYFLIRPATLCCIFWAHSVRSVFGPFARL